MEIGRAAAQLASDRSGLQTGLGWIYLILLLAAAGTFPLSGRMMPAMHTGEEAAAVQPPRDQPEGRTAAPRTPTEP